MLEYLTAEDRMKIRLAIFEPSVDETSRREVLTMLTSYDMNSNVLVSYLATKIEEKKLVPNTISILTSYYMAHGGGEVLPVAEAKKEEVMRKFTPRKEKAPKADKPAEKKIYFGDKALPIPTTKEVSQEQQMYYAPDGFYIKADSPANALLMATIGNWMSLEDTEALLLQLGVPDFKEEWLNDVSRFIRGSFKRYGWMGEYDVESVDDQEKVLVRIKPTPEWDGVTPPEGYPLSSWRTTVRKPRTVKSKEDAKAEVMEDASVES